MKAVYYSIFFVALAASSCSSEVSSETTTEGSTSDSVLTLLDSIQIDTFDYDNCAKAWDLEEAMATPDSFCNLKLGGYENQISEIPQEIEKMTHLRSLDLGANRITKIPAFLSDLEELSLYGNALKEWPQGLSELTSLKELDLSRNQLTELDESILKMKNLEVLRISGNAISEINPKIFELPNLREFFFTENSLEEIPQEVAKMKKLQVLSLSAMEVGDETFPPDHQMKSVNTLYAGAIYANSFQGEGNSLTTIPEWILEMDSLTHLFVDYGLITEIPEDIDRLEFLEDLNLEGNELESLPESIKNLKNLKSISLGGNKFSDEEIEKINSLFSDDVHIEWEEMNVGC